MQYALTATPERLQTLALHRPPLPPRDPRFIPPTAEMCQLAGEWKGQPLPAVAIGQEKIDGIRCLYFDGRTWSREGEALDLPDIAADLARLERRFGQPMFFDGEWKEPGGFLDTVAVMSSRGRRPARGACYLFDAVPLSEWRRDAAVAPFTARTALIDVALEGWTPKHLHRPLSRPVANAAQARAFAAEIWARGGEGIIVKDGASRYRRSRSDAWLKLKRGLEFVAPVVEIGAGFLAVEIEGRRVNASVPPPLRQTPFSVGMRVEIAAMEWSERGRLRQPRFVKVAS